MESGFVKASSTNLPRVDALMIGHFLSGHANYVGPEQRGVKLARSARESYGDSAIGYVQVKRDGGKCSVMAKITPEHKLKVKPYTVIVIVDEDEEIVEGANCYGCAAAVGGCKHSIAFLMWLHRRSEEPSSTEVENYWKKSKLSALGSDIMKVRDMTGASPLTVVEEGSFRKKVIAALAEEGQFESGLMSLNYCLNVTEFSIPQLLASFRERADEEVSALSFLKYAESLMREQNLCDTVFKSTLAQYESPLWHQLRLGRISASRAYDAIHCRKKDGVLVDMILGARKVGDTPAMKRGRELESKVVEELEKKLGGKIKKCGLTLNPDYPFMAASPDGVIGETLVEVKCPMKANRQQCYMVNGSPTVKYATQMTVQMLLSGMKECLYVVADPHFEHNKTISTCLFQFDDEFCVRIVNDCREFWCNTIFPLLYK